ncbi:unnamed protein product [Rangifer tarandus platyrhynchus]|uniref:Uncharacterized protein n=1 Tax=Rangifer tarandus platyrhynchus TaxID=3082113 RepID=A0AC59Y8Q7_RANTA
MICISLVVPICNLLAIAVDRYVTIFYILCCHSIMTMWKVLVLIVAIWLGCRVCSVMFIIYSESKMVIMCLVSMFLATLLLLGTLYVHMLLFGLLHIERITALLPADGVAHWPAALVCEGGSHHHQPAGGLHLLLGPLLSPPCPHCNLPHQPHCVCYTTHFNTHLIFIMCTSIINLLIYAFRSLELCNTFKGILCSCNSMKKKKLINRIMEEVNHPDSSYSEFEEQSWDSAHSQAPRSMGCPGTHCVMKHVACGDPLQV